MATSILALNDISKQFGSGEARVDALKHLTLQVDAGEFVALIGPSGSGKSTLLSIAGALLTATSGQLLLDGEDIAGMSPAQRTRIRLERIGFIFQGSNLVSYLTGREQLMFMAKLIKLPSSEANGKPRLRSRAAGRGDAGRRGPRERPGRHSRHSR